MNTTYPKPRRFLDDPRAGRPILAVEILNDRGEVLADVDAASTADALAYYLTSRRIDTDATERTVAAAADVAAADECIIRRTRNWDDTVAHDLTLVAAAKSCRHEHR